jgi:hypothetical protein
MVMMVVAAAEESHRKEARIAEHQEGEKQVQHGDLLHTATGGTLRLPVYKINEC